LKSAIDGTRWVVGIVAVVMIGGFSFLGFQLNRLEGRIDRIETAVAAIPGRLSEEFRAMRSEMAAQTSAIANSITATRQAPPAAPEIIVIPAPRSGEKSPEPKP
jgi:Flp pilus assembly pilin Flp